MSLLERLETWHEGEELLSFNTEGAYVGPKTPIYVDTEWQS